MKDYSDNKDHSYALGHVEWLQCDFNNPYLRILAKGKECDFSSPYLEILARGKVNIAQDYYRDIV